MFKNRDRAHEFVLPGGNPSDAPKLQIQLPHRHACIEVNQMRVDSLLEGRAAAVEAQSIARRRPQGQKDANPE